IELVSDGKLNKAKLSHGKDQENKIAEANASFEKSKKHWALQVTVPKSWLQNLQETLCIALEASSGMRHDISTFWTSSMTADWVASPLSFWALRVRRNFIRMIRRTLSASLPNLKPPRKRQQFTSKRSRRAKRLL